MGGRITNANEVRNTLTSRANHSVVQTSQPRGGQSFYTSHSSTLSAQPTASRMPAGMNPLEITKRESMPSAECIDPTTLFIAVDVTGSNTRISTQLLNPKSEGSFSNLYGFLEDYNVSGPQIAVAAIGDSKTDQCPLQVPQFEASAKFVDDLANLYQEAGGGGNSGESYHLAWYFAATKIRLGSMEQRGKKGVIVTVGDEFVHPKLTREEIKKFIDSGYEGPDLSNEELLAMVKSNWEVCHVFINTPHYHGAYDQFVSLLGADHVKTVNTFGQIAGAIGDLVGFVYPQLAPAATKLAPTEPVAMDTITVGLSWELFNEIQEAYNQLSDDLAPMAAAAMNQASREAKHHQLAMLESLVAETSYSLAMLNQLESNMNQTHAGWKDTSFATNASLAYAHFNKVKNHVLDELNILQASSEHGVALIS